MGSSGLCVRVSGTGAGAAAGAGVGVGADRQEEVSENSRGRRAFR